MKFAICGYCGKQFEFKPSKQVHNAGYCGESCCKEDELIGQAARAIEVFSEDELEANARMIDAEY